MKKHHLGNLTAYYTKKGRLWWVEKDGKPETFKSIEDMVSKYPELLTMEAIKMSVERRELARGPSVPVELNDDQTDAGIEYKTVECYYCYGTGEAAFMPCSNCGGKGEFEISTRGLT